MTLRVVSPFVALALVSLSPLEASPPAVVGEELTTTLAWQIALEGNGYSPGILDGAMGRKTRTAIAAVQAALGMAPSGIPDDRLGEFLGVDASRAVTTYRIAATDTKQVGETPTGWIARSRRRWLPYESLLDLVGEKFHTSVGCLQQLNPGVVLRRLGATDLLRVPLRRAAHERVQPAVSFLEIDLERRLVLLILENAQKQRFLQGLLHCSTARDRSRARVGEFHVTAIAINPTYTFNPVDWPEVRGVHEKLTIPPGPRGPVGTHWIGLDRGGLGIHGTPRPQNIGRTGSHGCFRLTNWDAGWLAGVLRRGTPVRIYARTAETSWPRV